MVFFVVHYRTEIYGSLYSSHALAYP